MGDKGNCVWPKELYLQALESVKLITPRPLASSLTKGLSSASLEAKAAKLGSCVAYALLGCMPTLLLPVPALGVISLLLVISLLCLTPVLGVSPLLIVTPLLCISSVLFVIPVLGDTSPLDVTPSLDVTPLLDATPVLSVPALLSVGPAKGDLLLPTCSPSCSCTVGLGCFSVSRLVGELEGVRGLGGTYPEATARRLGPESDTSSSSAIEESEPLTSSLIMSSNSSLNCITIVVKIATKIKSCFSLQAQRASMLLFFPALCKALSSMKANECSLAMTVQGLTVSSERIS